MPTNLRQELILQQLDDGEGSAHNEVIKNTTNG